MIIDLETLSKKEEREERSELTEDIFSKVLSSGVFDIKQLITREQNVIAVEAKLWCDKFWLVNEAMRNNDDFEPGYFGTRVLNRNGSISMQWYRTIFAKSGQTPFMKHLKKPKDSEHYPKQLFSRANDWEKEIIVLVESNYARLRRDLNTLKELKKSMTKYEKVRKSRLKDNFNTF